MFSTVMGRCNTTGSRLAKIVILKEKKSLRKATRLLIMLLLRDRNIVNECVSIMAHIDMISTGDSGLSTVQQLLPTCALGPVSLGLRSIFLIFYSLL